MADSGWQVMAISYQKGDATAPKDAGPTVIVDGCNDGGRWGKGFVLAISRRWREPEAVYRSAFAREPVPQLGDVQFVGVIGQTKVANLIGQNTACAAVVARLRRPFHIPAVLEGSKKVAAFAREHGASVTIIQDTLCNQGIAVTVYDFS
jgi:hypothetical protein